MQPIVSQSTPDSQDNLKLVMDRLESIDKTLKYAFPPLGVQMWRSFLIGLSQAIAGTIMFTILSTIIGAILFQTVWPMVQPFFGVSKTSGPLAPYEQILKLYGGTIK
jgi:hypothetical protein